MLKKLLNKIEEKYVFNISQYFWHIFIALSSLVLIGGILLLLWGVIPPGKDKVEKENYPPVVEVSADEVLSVLNQLEKKKEVTIKKKNVEKTITSDTYSDPNEKAYYLSLNSLKKLIPPEKYSWKSRGHWYYPYGERYYLRNKNSRWANQYRQWIVTETGINEKLESAYSKSFASNFHQRKLILDSYINIIKRFVKEKRASVLKLITNYYGSTPTATVDNMKAILASTNNFTTDKTNFIKTLVKFGSQNPKEGKIFINYTSKALIKFILEFRHDVLKTMISSFYSYFNNNVEQQIEITDLFLKDIKKYQPEEYTKALEIYYQLMVSNNRQRERNIENIEQEYSFALAQANAEYEMAKVEKADLRIKGVYLGAGAVSAIAILALVLVLLSIQRYVKRIVESLKLGKA